MKIVAAVALVVAMAAVATAECPNACSGNGICGKNDMCVCDRNFQGSDCSERVCPYGHAFITTPQGDLNMDGDRDDNSWKRLSSTISIFLRDTERLTFVSALRSYDQASSGLGSSEDANMEDGVVELEAGDKIKVGDEVFTVKKKVSDTIYDMTTHAKQTWSGYQAYKFISTQARPQGTWEMWPGDFPGSGTEAAEDEGHYYMECSNRGLCDRKTGECECFDGYTGIGCTRQSCPEGCSGHGQCDTVESLRVSQPTKLSITVQTHKDSKDVYTSGPHTLQANDFVKIGNHKSMKISSTEAAKITLENEFPHTLPFGTEIWQEHHYDLWDSNKNRACKCDPMWTGNDCSLRKCPFGDDPLTVTSMDPTCEGCDTTADGYTTDASEYYQKAEKQSLWVESTSGRLTGTFTLTFTDEYGDKWETLPIPNKVRMSQYGTSSSGVITFADAGLLPDEVGINDYIMVGQNVCRVSKLAWKNTQTKTHYNKAYCGVTTAIADVSDSPVYRITVAKEIRDALKALPNHRIPDVTVETITSQGRFAFTDDDGSDKTQATLTGAGTGAFNQDFVVGDYARIGKDIRYVSAITLDDGSGDDKDTIEFNTDLSVDADGLAVFRQNGFRYDILFEYGCRTHWDCQNNGVDQNDSDGPPASSSTDIGDGAASCHPAGACQCSDDAAFGGSGCTADRRAPHANARVSVSGNLANLVCDYAGLTPSAVLASTGTVLRVTPLTITATGDETSTVKVGDQVRMENQVRTVVAITSSAITVDRPFEEDEFSTDANIFPALTPIVFVESKEKDDGMVVECFATDLPPLLTEVNCASADGKANGCGTGELKNITDPNPQRKVDIENEHVVDIRELEVGDRVRIYNKDELGQKWNTRTVDSITLTNALPTSFTVSEALSFSNTNEMRVFVDNSGTTEEASCSNRGLCDESTGECQCFNGYTDVDCSKQNALAL